MSAERLWLVARLSEPARAELRCTRGELTFLHTPAEHTGDHFRGHFDWLRDADGRIVGVRFFPLWEHEDPEYARLLNEARAACEALPFTAIERGTLSVRFTPDGEVVEAKSCDQELGASGILRGEPGGALSLYFEVDLWFDGAFVLA